MNLDELKIYSLSKAYIIASIAPGIFYFIITLILKIFISLPNELWLVILILFIPLVILPTVVLLVLPYEVTATESNNLIFRSVFFKREISIEDVILIVEYPLFLKHCIKYKNGQIFLEDGIKNMRELKYRILKHNPFVQVIRIP